MTLERKAGDKRENYAYQKMVVEAGLGRHMFLTQEEEETVGV